MSKPVKRLLLWIWIIFSTLALARLWLARPDYFPSVPPAVTLWLIDLYGSTNGEELRDLETLTALGVAFVIVLAVTAIVPWAWRKARSASAALECL